MDCDVFESYALGKTEEEDFRRHLERCASCQKRLLTDERLMALTDSLEPYTASPSLWCRIQSSLEAEASGRRTGLRIPQWRRMSPVLRWAVVVVVLVGLGSLQGKTRTKIHKVHNLYIDGNYINEALKR